MGAREDAFSAGVWLGEGLAPRIVENGVDEGAGLGDQEEWPSDCTYRWVSGQALY